MELYQLIGGDLNQLTNYLGARSTNIQNANIPGMELSIVGQGNFTEDLSFTTLAGYTFIHPTLLMRTQHTSPHLVIQI